MLDRSNWNVSARAAAIMIGAALSASDASAASFQLIGSVGRYESGQGGLAPFTADAQGNLYVPDHVTSGHLYLMTAASSYTSSNYVYGGFGGVQIGAVPNRVAVTKHNDILGTTFYGGVSGGGVVYNIGKYEAISPVILHAFDGGVRRSRDGSGPQSGLAEGLFNRYYGTTPYGGLHAAPQFTGDGVVFQVRQSVTDPKFSIIHLFGGAGDGINPTSGTFAVDSQGRMYGETISGGANGLGTVFVLRHTSGSGWRERVIYSFQPTGDLATPTGNVVLDSAGNLYGCAQGGTHGQGGIFRLTPPAQAGGAWREAVLYNFGDQPADPVASFTFTWQTVDYGCGLTIDPSTGVIVGTSYGGGHHDKGTIFTLTPPAAGGASWTELVGHDFKGDRDGEHPEGALAEVGGVFYGGTTSNNEVFAFTP